MENHWPRPRPTEVPATGTSASTPAGAAASVIVKALVPVRPPKVMAPSAPLIPRVPYSVNTSACSAARMKGSYSRYWASKAKPPAELALTCEIEGTWRSGRIAFDASFLTV